MKIYMLARLGAACFLIITYTYFYFHKKKRLKVMTSHVFECCILAADIHALTAAFTEYTVNFRRELPPWALNSLHTVYMMSLLLFCALLLYYYFLYFERARLVSFKRHKVVLLIVTLTAMLAVASLPITYMDTPFGSYCSGLKVKALNFTMLYVFVVLVELLVRYYHTLKEHRDWVLLGAVVLLIGTAIVQMTMPYLMITCLTLTLMIITMMVSAEDAHAYTDADTGMYNERGLTEILKELLLTGDSFPIGMYCFVGADPDILRAAHSLPARVPIEKRDYVFCTPFSDMVLAVPLRRFSGVGALPSPLPQPDVDKTSGLKYTCDVVTIKPNTELSEIREKMLEFKAHFNENEMMRDELTGLLRRNAFRRRAERIISAPQSFAFVMLDLDNFKGVNDRYGHAVGDKVLKGVAEAFSSTLRSGDVVCRIGGDEFSAVLPGVKESHTLIEIARRVQVRVNEMNLLPDCGREVRISMGAKLYDEGHALVRFEDAYDAADMALYEAKRAGKGQIHVSV